MAVNWGQLNAKFTIESFQNKIPYLGQFELTTRCNLGCRMCYACSGLQHKELKAKELSAGEWIHLAEQARDMGMLFLLLTGGEVFLREDFKEIYEGISKLGLIISIYSNGTLITEKVIEWLKKMPPSQIDISLYGASPETYRRVCGNSSGFYKAVAGIRRLKEAGINTRIRTTIIRENYGDLDMMREIAESFGLGLDLVDYISPERERRDVDTGRLSPKKQTEFLNMVHPFLPREEFPERIPEADQNADTFRRAEECREYFGENTSFPCSAGKTSFFTTWEGSMVPCSIMNTPKAFPLIQGFPAAWLDLIKKCERVPVCRTCSKCSIREYCNACPGRLLNETGSFTEPAPYLCEMARENARLVAYRKKEEMV